LFTTSAFRDFQASFWEPLPSLVFGVFATISGLLYSFLPETLDQPLADTVEEAEQQERLSGKNSKLVTLREAQIPLVASCHDTTPIVFWHREKL